MEGARRRPGPRPNSRPISPPLSGGALQQRFESGLERASSTPASSRHAIQRPRPNAEVAASSPVRRRRSATSANSVSTPVDHRRSLNGANSASPSSSPHTPAASSSAGRGQRVSDRVDEAERLRSNAEAWSQNFEGTRPSPEADRMCRFCGMVSTSLVWIASGSR